MSYWKDKLYFLKGAFKAPFFVIFGLLVVAVFLIFFSRGISKNYVLKGVYFDGEDLSGWSYQEVGKFIDNEYVDFLDGVVEVRFGRFRRNASLRDLGVEFDTKATLQNVYDFSYGDSLGKHIRTRWNGIWGMRTDVDPIFVIDRSRFAKSLNVLFPEIHTAVNAEVFFLANGDVDYKSHEDGIVISFDETYDLLYAELADMEIDVVELVGREVLADYRTDDAMRDAHLYRWYLGQELVLKNELVNYERRINFPREWVKIYKGDVNFNLGLMRQNLEEVLAMEIDQKKSDLEIISIPEEEAGYVDTVGELRDGYMVDVDTSLVKMVDALIADEFEIELEVYDAKGKIINRTENNLGDMELLAVGRSNFSGSTAGRAFNVRKGIEEKMNNILVQPGGTFGFNSFLGGPVTYANGWKGALAIFNGKDLEEVPGGGLCQVSTTVYRAALNAGLKVVEKRNHSLYVHYYREYGNGLDATIYPGQQDLKFVNDTANYILIRSWTDGEDAFVGFYGTDDGRDVQLEGPFYWNTIPENYKSKISLGRSQIAWVQKIYWPDGSYEENILKSSYRNAIQR